MVVAWGVAVVGLLPFAHAALAAAAAVWWWWWWRWYWGLRECWPGMVGRKGTTGGAAVRACACKFWGPRAKQQPHLIATKVDEENHVLRDCQKLRMRKRVKF